MLETLKNAPLRVVGSKQVLKAIAAGQLMSVYLAEDADAFILQKIIQACAQHGVVPVRIPTMRELGEACSIDVGAACAGVPHP